MAVTCSALMSVAAVGQRARRVDEDAERFDLRAGEIVGGSLTRASSRSAASRMILMTSSRFASAMR
jgi:hypothetical protein